MDESVKLTNDQEKAWSSFVRFFYDMPDEREFTLLGFAGCGKTFLVRQLVEEFTDGGWTVACTAPTNKAVQVLSRFGKHNPRLMFSTLHQYLGLKPRIDPDTGAETYERDPMKGPPTSDLLVVDEASMVNSQLYGLVKQYLSHNAKVLWVGDPAQLPPVGERDSPSLLLGTGSQLRQVVRYGNAIERYVTKVRECAVNPDHPLPEPVPEHADEEGVFVRPRREWMAALIADFKSEAYRKDPGYVRALAWRNKLVDWGNTVIHQQLYGADAKPFMPGQTLIAKTPVFREGVIVMSTSDECKVLTALPSSHHGLSCWQLSVELAYGQQESFYTLADEAKMHFELQLQQLKDAALAARDRDLRRQLWRRYYDHQRVFADLGPAYWSTVHKAQGSTFERAYVAGVDLMDNPNVSERNRMLYTAYTRASKQLVLIQPGT